MTTYMVNFYHPTTGDLLEMLDNTSIIQLTYERLANDISNFSITCMGESRLADVIPLVDMLAEVRRVNPTTQQIEVEETYLCRHFEMFQDENGQEFIIVAGFSLNHLLKRRLIIPEDDMTGAGGWSTKADLASTVIYEFVRDQAISPVLNTDRGFAGLTANVTLGVGGYIFQRLQYENLFEIVQQCAMQGNVDFRIVRTSGVEFEFQCGHFGTDYSRRSNEGLPNGRFVLFELPRDNIISPQLTFDHREEQNVCYVFGQGPENDREIVEVTSGTVNDSPWNTLEVKTDARNNEIGDYEGLVLDGQNHLQENAPITLLTFELSEMERFEYYNVRWSLYDTVSARYGGYETDLRIMGVNVTFDEKGDKIEVVLAEATTFVDPLIAVLLRRPSADELEQGLGLINARLRRQAKKENRDVNYLGRAEVAGARPRADYADIDLGQQRVGMMWWVRDGRKPGEGAGAGTGVPAEWDGTNLVSGYDGSPVVV